MECPRPVRMKAHTVDERTGTIRRNAEEDRYKPCGCWGCEVCGPVKERQYVGHFTETFKELPDLFFATLTLDPKVEAEVKTEEGTERVSIVEAARGRYIERETGGPNMAARELVKRADELRKLYPRDERRQASELAETAEDLAQESVELLTRKYLQHVWSKWRKRLNYRSKKRWEELHGERGGGVQYMRSIEPQGSGVAHAHAILSAPGLTPGEIAAAWFECGGGVSCEVEPIIGEGDEVARRVGYATKYALKDARSGRSPKGRHYIETSEGIGYGSAAAVQKRAEYVALERGEEPPAPPSRSEFNPVRERDWWATSFVSVFESDRQLEVGGEGEHQLWIADVSSSGGTRADTITPEDRAFFDGLELSKRTTEYHTQDDNGEWWRVEYLDGEVKRTESPSYRSLFQQRMEAAAGGGGPDPAERGPP